MTKAESLALRISEREAEAEANPSIRMMLLVPSRTTDKRPKGGTRPEDLPTPTRAQLIRHAEQFGTDGVHEVAAALLNEKDAAFVKIELDRIDAEAPRRRFEKAPARRRRSEDETRAAGVALIESGLNPQAAANRLGVSVARFRRLIRSVPAPK